MHIPNASSCNPLSGRSLLKAPRRQSGQGASRAGRTGLHRVRSWGERATRSRPHRPHDPWLARPALRVVADAWAGDLSLDDPLVSPLFGEMAGLPAVEQWVGTRDICLPDCRLLRDRLAGVVEVTHHELLGGLHVVPLLPVPEGEWARRRIVERIRAGLTPAG